ILRSARVIGLRTVAVYSDADAGAAHVVLADEACRIGPPEPAQSYLNLAAILDAARATGADAIHPGYGFLSERPEFARAVVDAGLTFIGPPADVMAALGDKLAARHIAITAGVPVVPGIDTADLATAREFGAKTGFPILVKAAAGGGGRGMRVVASSADLASALEAASREAQAAFGDGRVFLEKYLARPRHIEIQLLGDHHGKVIALGERECSIQRRHQKLIEESPAPGLSDGIRARMIDAALRLARAAAYRNAGTAEFLVDGSDFYFLEVNARLQVEHPVTEIRFDRDLVCDQIAIATGAAVSDPITPHGCAIECRINAEDAAHDFRPAIGPVLHLSLPAGPGVRVDTHLAVGAEISPYYDSLLAKVICWGENREQARLRMVAALDEFSLLGPQTSAAFLRDVVASAPFTKGDLSTRFLPEFFPNWSLDAPRLRSALLAAALLGSNGAPIADYAARDGAARPQGQTSARSPWSELGSFEPWGRR
ncbi:MAG TPA: biotin carboxylase N-terminal domain-containing protein, partial [Candidatus Binataceae bacterium]|nr:biotin carboxylase N-terminal domain-containing protein [Candidatus Binataceae bacterium]